jgi:hypothetical protein
VNHLFYLPKLDHSSVLASIGVVFYYQLHPIQLQPRVRITAFFFLVCSMLNITTAAMFILCTVHG